MRRLVSLSPTVHLTDVTHDLAHALAASTGFPIKLIIERALRNELAAVKEHDPDTYMAVQSVLRSRRRMRERVA